MNLLNMRLCSNGDGRQAFRRGLCRSCYGKAPRALAPPGEGGQLGAVRVPPALITAMLEAAKAEGIDLATWRRRAYEQHVTVQQRMQGARDFAYYFNKATTAAAATFRPATTPSAAVECVPGTKDRARRQRDRKGGRR